MKLFRHRPSTYKSFRRKAFFRDRKNLVILGAVFLAVILAVLIIVFSTSKKIQTITYTEMSECTLPVMTMEYNNRQINRLFGYTSEMDPKYMHDCLYVLEDGYDLKINAQTYGLTISDISFSLYDIDANNLVQSAGASEISQEEGKQVSAVLTIENLIVEGTEYVIDIVLESDSGQKIHYYSRLMKNTTSKLSELMDMTIYHHSAMYDASKSDFLTQYQNPIYRLNDNTNFGYITLYSSVYAMCWGTLNVSVITEPIVEIVDLDNDIACFRLDYQVERISGETSEYYNVSDYYRTRHAGENDYILDYERSANEVFIPSEDDFGNKSVILGIDSDLTCETMSNSKGSVDAFVTGGSLWMMNTETKTMERIFSFENDFLDERESNDSHDIKIVNVSDDGDIQFLVYGYMNKGTHEGRAGIGLYQYSAEDDEVREEVFIPSDLPYEIIKNSIGNLCYLNNDNILYIMLDEYVYALDLNENKASLVVHDLEEGSFKVGATGRMLAWNDEGSVNDATKINVMDLETGETYSAMAEEGQCIKILGFLNTDTVYGSGEAGNIYTTAEGNEYLLMDTLYVVNSKNGIQSKEKSDTGFYISSSVEYNRVIFNRVVKDGETFRQTEEFTLFATDLEDYNQSSTYTTYDDDKRTILSVEFVTRMDSDKPLTLADDAKVFLSNSEATDVGTMLTGEGKYYVYAAGEIKAILTDPAEAIKTAYECTGSVITNKGGYFYRRSSRPSTVELTSASITNAVQSYTNENAINVTGITLTEALYFTSKKIPLVWENKDGTYIIYGYDYYDNLMLYDIKTKETSLVAYSDADDGFEDSGRLFVVE